MTYEQLAGMGLAIDRAQLDKGFCADGRSFIEKVPEYFTRDQRKPKAGEGEDLSHLNPKYSRVAQESIRTMWRDADAERLARLTRRNQKNAEAHIKGQRKQHRNGARA